MFFSRLVGKQNVGIHTQDILHNTKEGTNATCNKIEESQRNDVEQKRMVTKKFSLCDSISLKF